MDRTAACALLGVSVDTPWSDVRAAYRRLLHEHHPDHASVDERTDHATRTTRTTRTAQLTVAYQVLREMQREMQRAPADESATSSTFSADPMPPPDDDSRRLLLDATPEEAYFALVEASHAIGFVSYVDRQSGVLEVIVTPTPGEVTSIVIEVLAHKGRSLAVLYAEPLGRHAPASLDEFTEQLARKLAASST